MTEEQNVIADVRAAKTWVDCRFATLEELGAHLRAVEQAYRERSGEFAGIPKERSAEVQAAIDAADREPGRGMLEETRQGRTK